MASPEGQNTGIHLKWLLTKSRKRKSNYNIMNTLCQQLEKSFSLMEDGCLLVKNSTQVENIPILYFFPTFASLTIRTSHAAFLFSLSVSLSRTTHEAG